MKRLITYLYAYENGKKEKNTGYIKVYIKDDKSQMETHINGLGRYQGSAEIYLLVMDEGLVGIDVGEITITNGVGNSMIVINTEGIGNSRYSISNIIGVRIECSNDQFLASCWNEQMAEKISSHMKLYEHSDRESKKDECSKIGEAFPEQKAVCPRTSYEQKSEKELSINNSLLQIKNQMIKNQIENQSENRTGKGELNKNQIEKVQTGKEQIVKEQIEKVQTKKEPIINIQDDLFNVRQNNFENYIDLVNNYKNAANNQAQKQNRQNNNMSEKNDNTVPLPENSMTIDIGEIHNLPKRNWYLCNNSFLLHGYLNYHYLIIKTVEENGNKKKYIGVPGIYERPERTMALLFGFSQFEAIEKDPGEGSFGYWYCLLDI